MVFVFLYLPSLCMRISRSNVWLQMPVFHSFMADIPLCVCVYLLRFCFGATFWGVGPLYPLCSLQSLQGRVLPASSSAWGLQVALGWWLPASHVCLHLHMAFPLCLGPWMEAPPIQEALLSDPSHDFSVFSVVRVLVIRLSVLLHP